MENKNIDNVHSNMCQCRCPCHFKDPVSTPSLKGPAQSIRDVSKFQQCSVADDAASHQITNIPHSASNGGRSATHSSETSKSGTDTKKSHQNSADGSRKHRNSAEIEPKFAVRPKPLHPPQNISEYKYKISESESDLSKPYNPFRKSGLSPATAAISKSFLHAKNIVKHMTARWESLHEPTDDENSTKRYSLTGRLMNRINGTVDKGDQTEWKSKVPTNIEEHIYSLEPLQSNRNFKPANDSHSLSVNENIQRNYTCSRLAEPTYTHVSFQQVPKSVDNVSQKELEYFHSTNPFKQKEESTLYTEESFEVDEIEANVNSQPFHLEDIEIKQPFGMLVNCGPHITKIPMRNPKLPHSIQSEVKHIRKSFEDEVDQIVANVNTLSYDTADSPEFYLEGNLEMAKTLETAPKVIPNRCTAAKSIRKVEQSQPRTMQSEVKQIRKSFEDEIDGIVTNVNRERFNLDIQHLSPSKANIAVKKPSTLSKKHIAEKSLGHIGKSAHRKETEWLANNKVLSTEGRINSKGNLAVFAAKPTRFDCAQSPIGTMHPATVENKSDDEEENFATLDSENPENFSLREKSLANKMLDSTGSKSRTMTGCHYQESKSTFSAPSKLYLSRSDHHHSGINEAPENDIRTSEKIASELPVALSRSISKQQRDEKGNEIDKSSQNLDDRKPISSFSSKLRPHVLCPKESIEGLIVAEHYNHGADYNDSRETSRSKTNPGSTTKAVHGLEHCTENYDKQDHKILVQQSDHDRKMENFQPQDSTYIAWISVPNGTESTVSKVASEHSKLLEESTSTLLGYMADVALELHGHGIKRGSIGESELVLATLSKEYDNVVATPSTLRVETIGHSKSVTNTLSKMSKQRSSSHPIRHLAPSETGWTTRQSSSDLERRTNPSRPGKMEFYICHKCHKVVESHEAAFHCSGGFEFAWHRFGCFKCCECEKDLSQSDHSFFEQQPYCMKHYIRKANIPTCFKCQEHIFDSTYTSAAGNSYHSRHFTCEVCRKPLVDTKYVFSENKQFCLHCHEKHFPKQCRTCLHQIASQEPYVQAGNSFWHSSSSCLHCARCYHSLVGRTLFFRKDGQLYCNRYCAVREM